MESDFVLFRVNHNYFPKEGELELKVADECYVKKPISDPLGMLDGVNMRTKCRGLFPGNYCTMVNENARPPRPPKSKKPTVVRRSKMMKIGDHDVEKINIKKPVWCNNCDEYIWGGSRISLMCIKCMLCSHAGCHHLFNWECIPNASCVTRDEVLKVYSAWSNQEILEWMVACRLHPYLHAIESNSIMGIHLAHLTEEYLKSIGIINELHLKMFRACLNELLLPEPQHTELLAEIPLSINNNIDSHQKLYEHTFTTYQDCDLCKKPMFGIFKQGYMCAECAVQCHRHCAFVHIEECAERRRRRRISDSEDPSFCCNFTSTIIPPVMRKCIEAVENADVLSPHLYTKEVPHENWQTLRSALNQDPELVNMYEDSWKDPSCSASVLKSFLLELPNPLVSEKFYTHFLQLSASVDYTVEAVSALLRQLPSSNYSHLDTVLKHLLFIITSSNDASAMSTLSDVFALLLIRPTEKLSGKLVVQNLHQHKEVVYMLLWAAHQREKLDPQRTIELSRESWFWSDASRKEVTQHLQGTSDGHFLVRPSENRRGEWTLTVRKEGKDRLIKISQRNGRYGFQANMLNFSSLKFLIEYFQTHSLNEMSSNLDVKLLHPCMRAKKPLLNEKNDELVKEKYMQIDEKLKEIKCIEFKTEEMQKLLEDCKMFSEAQTDVVAFVSEQHELTSKQLDEASPEDRLVLLSSVSRLETILHAEKTMWQELDDELMSLTHEYDMLNAQLTELGTELPILQAEYNLLESQMEEIHPEEMKKIRSEKMEDIYDVLPISQPRRASCSQDYVTQDNLDEKYWLYEDINRNRTVEWLGNKPNGTFLVRRSNLFPYSISLVHNNEVKHIPVYKGENGYGFAEPHNIYKTLQSLINHYHLQSLRMHNHTLDTTLKFPYGFFETQQNE